MTRKVLFILIGFILTPIILAFIAMQLIQIYYFQNFHLTFDYRLLFIQENNNILYLVAIATAFIYFTILLNSIVEDRSKTFKKDTSKDKQGKNYSTLLSKNRAKRGLVRVEFTKAAKTKDFTVRYILDLLTNPFKKTHNAVIDLFRFDHQLKLNTLEQFQTNQDKHYRPGIPLLTFFNRVYVDAKNNHSLIIGTTNSGKTYSLIHIFIMICIMGGENIIVNDVKGELYQTHYPLLKHLGYNVISFNFIHPQQGSYYNPLSLVIDSFHEAYVNYRKELVNYKQEIVELLDLLIDYEETGKFDIIKYKELMHRIESPNFSEAQEILVDVCNKITQESKNDKDGFWNDSAGDLLEGLILLLLEEKEVVDGEVRFLNPNAINFMTISILSNYLSAEDGKPNAPSPLIQYIKTNRKETDLSVIRLRKIIKASSQTLSSIAAVFNRVTKKLLINEDIIRMMSKSDFDLSKIDKQKTAIFIIVHDEKNTFHNIVSIIIQQIYEVLLKSARSNLLEGRTKKEELIIPANFIWDEFANGSKWKNIINGLTAGRSRNIRFNLVIQDLGQLESLYGKEDTKSIMSNTVNTLFLLSGDNQTNEEISKRCGKKLIYNKAHNRYDETPLVSTDRLSKLGLGEILVLRQRRDPYITKFRAFNKYNCSKFVRSLRKKYKLPDPRKLDKYTYINLINKTQKDLDYYEKIRTT